MRAAGSGTLRPLLHAGGRLPWMGVPATWLRGGGRAFGVHGPDCSSTLGFDSASADGRSGDDAKTVTAWVVVAGERLAGRVALGGWRWPVDWTGMASGCSPPAVCASPDRARSDVVWAESDSGRTPRAISASGGCPDARPLRPATVSRSRADEVVDSAGGRTAWTALDPSGDTGVGVVRAAIGCRPPVRAIRGGGSELDGVLGCVDSALRDGRRLDSRAGSGVVRAAGVDVARAAGAGLARAVSTDLARAIDDVMARSAGVGVVPSVRDGVAGTAEDGAAGTAEDRAAETAEDRAAETAEDRTAETAEDRTAETAEDGDARTASDGDAGTAGDGVARAFEDCRAWGADPGRGDGRVSSGPGGCGRRVFSGLFVCALRRRCNFRAWRWVKPQARWRSCSRRNSSFPGE
jgi:hypothetical protein